MSDWIKNPMVVEAVGAILRWGGTILFAWLMTKGIFTEEQATRFTEYVSSPGVVAGVLGLLVTGILAVVSAFRKRQKLVTALAMPAETTERQVEKAIKDPTIQTPPVSKEKTKAPYIRTNPLPNGPEDRR